MIRLGGERPREIALLGAHCDDLAIGLGGTLLALAGTAGDPIRVHALVLTGAGTERECEEQAALEALCPHARLDLTVLGFPDGHTPAHWADVKSEVAALATRTRAEIVFAPNRGDAHQDHRMLAEIAPTVFRDHLILGYEIVKWETDMPHASVFHPLTTAQAEAKARVLCEHYPSQAGHDWFDRSTFLALSRLRGVQCRSDHAEAFLVDKAVIEFRKGPDPCAYSSPDIRATSGP